MNFTTPQRLGEAQDERSELLQSKKFLQLQELEYSELYNGHSWSYTAMNRLFGGNRTLLQEYEVGHLYLRCGYFHPLPPQCL